MLKIGLLGCGQHATNTMIPNIIGNTQCKIVAACDLDVKKLDAIKDRIAGIATFTDAEEMFKKSNLDIVVISISPDLHVKYSDLAIEYGINIYVEKPIGHNYLEIKKLYEKSKANNIIVEYGAKWRFTNATKIAKQWIEDNKKQINLLTLDATFPVGLVKNPWGLSPINGAIQEVFVHAFDYILYWMGYDISDISVSFADKSDWHQALNVIIKNKDGVISSLNLIKGSGAYQSNFILHTKSGEQIKIYNLNELEITTNDSWAHTDGTFRDHPSFNWEQGRLYRSWARAGMAEVWNALVDAINNKDYNHNAFERAFWGQWLVQQTWDKFDDQENI